MNRNVELYNACIALLQVSKLVRPVDLLFANELLNKAEEYKNQIVPVDDETEKEIKEYADRIRGKK
jgi:hypothetical protein